MKETNDVGSTAIHAAASSGHVDVIQQLISWGLSVNEKSKTGMTPFLMAAKHSQTVVMEFLEFKHSADVTARDVDGCNALMLAACSAEANTPAKLERNEPQAVVISIVYVLIASPVSFSRRFL